MAIHSWNHIDLCTGSGMLGLAVKLALGGDMRTVAYVERESYAAASLVARMEDEALDYAPVWDDLLTICDEEFTGAIPCDNRTILTAGFPCQPFSCAGKRHGADDERHLWPAIARYVAQEKPGVVFFENVPGLISTRTIHHRADLCAIIDDLDAAAARAETARDRWYIQYSRERLYRRLLNAYGISSLLYVLCDLERLCYRATAGLFSAEEVGASHRRERVFILAVANTEGSGLGGGGLSAGQRRSGAAAACACGASKTVDNATGPRCNGAGRGPAAVCPGGECVSRAGCAKLADAGGTGLEGAEWNGTSGERNGAQASGPVAEFRPPLFAPSPADLDEGREILAHDPSLEPAVCRVADGLAPGMVGDRLRLTGNGVVPLAAAYAFVSLAAALCGE